ncbi:ornithine cyclodeaminase family protein [uncultured Ruegeria sp.]|uniref:ornithine cyclodeaminase family protein n=1 Tax=uncultured Ruegeria sp. TaxID=259304 RepID=UPI00260464F4|nr:ornithine cyclodeaminase family protein [uncultured Ruegeria sp.]
MTELILHDAIKQRLAWPDLIEQLRTWFKDGAVSAPDRQVLNIEQPDGSTSSVLIMPAWMPGEAIGVKVVTFFPQNAAIGQPTINAGYMAFDGQTGRLTAVMDGDALTARRTAAASALAASYLARTDARTLLVVGTGQLSIEVASAHAAVRSYDKVLVWGRSEEKAAALASEMQADGLPAIAVQDLEAACAKSDVITTVTASTRPVVHGSWLTPGTHLDLIGAFREDMRECDDAAMAQADIFVDTRTGAIKAGDLYQPITDGVLSSTDIVADLTELCRGEHRGRRDAFGYTVFKSVGLALEDLAAASLVLSSSK